MTDERGRYVGLRCPLCDSASPTVDQTEDPHRDGMNNWWMDHRRGHLPYPIVELRDPPEDTP